MTSANNDLPNSSNAVRNFLAKDEHICRRKPIGRAEDDSLEEMSNDDGRARADFRISELDVSV